MRTILGVLWSLSPLLCYAQQTDPNRYQARVAAEVRPYLTDCKKYWTFESQTDARAVAQCIDSQAIFADEYYEALEGNQQDKYDIAFMFQRGDQHGVLYNPVMACAWWIEASSTGGRLPAAPFDGAVLAVCMQSRRAVLEAATLHSEEDRISNLTY
jgi:hypothetical protein